MDKSQKSRALYHKVRRWRKSPIRSYAIGKRTVHLPKPVNNAMKPHISREEYQKVIDKVLRMNGWVYKTPKAEQEP